MEQLTAIEFLEQNKEYLFPNKVYPEIEIEEALMSIPDEMEMTIRSIPFKKPSTVKLISFFPGSLGVDRFYLGDIKGGILKYFTFGGAGIWWIKDIITAEERCRAYNCKKLLEAINDPAVVTQMCDTNDKISDVISKGKKYAPVAGAAVKGAKKVHRTFWAD